MRSFKSRNFGPRQPRTAAGQANRTPTFSYRANRLPAEEVSGKRKENRRRRPQFQWRQIPFYLVVLVALVSVVYTLTLSQDPKVIIQNQQALAVSESALATREDLELVRIAGARAVLIGTSFCAAPNIGNEVREVMGW